MRAADPSELTTPAVPVLTARLSETELSHLIPVRFKDVTNPEEVREPSKAALIRLDSGNYIVLFYGRDSKELTVEVPRDTDLSRSLAAFLLEVPLPASSIFWHRPDVTVRKSTVSSKQRSRALKAAKTVPPRATSKRRASTSRKSSKKR